jgi:hypothetical protein
MRQLQVRKSQRPAASRWRREWEREAPLDPRDPDVVRAKALTTQRGQLTRRAGR